MTLLALNYALANHNFLFPPRSRRRLATTSHHITISVEHHYKEVHKPLHKPYSHHAAW